MESAQQALKSVANYSISMQQQVWSWIGIKPSQLEAPASKPSRTTFIHGNGLCHMSIHGITRLAGISGAAAVAMSALSAHKVTVDPTIDERRKKAVENGSKHHFIHTLALLFATKARYPTVTAAFFASGILLFCVPCYAYGIWNNDKVRTVTPLGGLMLILGWLSFAL